MMLAKALASASASAPKVYVEDVFSTWLYTGNGSTQTITNGIDLSGKGGLVWLKSRNNAYDHVLCDTARGAGKALFSNLSSAQATDSDLPTYNSDGFTLKPYAIANGSGATFTSWTFRKAAKFFDVVTFAKTTDNQVVNHNLGATPGFVLIKSLDAGQWWAFHRATSGGLTGGYLVLNSTAAFNTDSRFLTGATSTTITVGEQSNGQTYVAYLFAHDAGGFGDSGNDSVVKCGSYTGNYSTSGPTINLGWEPQWLLIKRADAAEDWLLFDSMRGCSWTAAQELKPHTSGSEGTGSSYTINFLPSGFKVDGQRNNVNANGGTYIYIAIRRGPMKTPTDATQVYIPLSVSISSNPQTFTTNFSVDHVWTRSQNVADSNPGFASRLTNARLVPDSTAAESATSFIQFDFNDRVRSSYNNPGFGTIQCMSAFRRAPGFFDVVCYTGTGTAQSVNHNLGVAPELLINKSRSSDVNFGWPVYAASLGNNKVVRLNEVTEVGNSGGWNNQTPTSSQFFVNGYNTNGVTYIAYLFASCPGVSKVGSYTGTGTTHQIDCGFTSGARFVLIKRTNTAGNWFVWDAARGIVAGNDPYLLLNSTSSESTFYDYIDPYPAGFELTDGFGGTNASGDSYIYLAIA